MSRRPLDERNLRKLTKVGGGSSYCVTIPIETIREFGWKEKQKLVVKPDQKNKRIIIEDWKK